VAPSYGLSRKNVWLDDGDAHSYFLRIADFWFICFIFSDSRVIFMDRILNLIV